MNSSTGVEQSIALGTEQKPIWCYEGIDLYVSLELDSTESTRVDSLSPWASSDAPRPAQVYPHDHTSVAPPADVVIESSSIPRTLHNGERKQLEISRDESAATYRVLEKPTCTHLGLGELDKLDHGEVLRRECRALGAETRVEQIMGQGKQSGGVEARRSVPGVAVRRFIARFVAPLAVQSDEARCLNNSAQTSSGNRQLQERNDQPDQLSSEDDHEKVCDLEGQCRQCKYEFSSRGNVVSGCRCLAVNHKVGELKSVSQEDLEDQPTDQNRRDEAFYSCNENRSWSPQVEDHSWVPLDMSRDPDNRLTGCSEGITDVGEELDQDCPNVPSSFSSEKDAVGRILQLEHNGNPSLETLLAPSKFPDIESFDVADILAACQLVNMSAFDCRKNFSDKELSAMKGYDLNNLEFGGESIDDRLLPMVEKMYGSLPDIDVSDTRINSLQPRVGKLDLSPWSDEDKYIPRIARRARGRLRGSQFSTRIDFGNTEVDEDSDCEVLQRPPSKRQYKSTQELLLA